MIFSRDFVPINKNLVYRSQIIFISNLCLFESYPLSCVLSNTFPIDHLLIACYRDIKLIIQVYLFIKHINYHNARTKIQSLYTKFI